jgi:ferredoxin--NADP+ reductase
METFFMIQTVKEVTHYTDKLFKIKTDRPKTFRFHAGEFVMVGMGDYDSAPKRAYSICSGPYDDELEFYSIKVPDGPLTSKLQHIKVGDEIYVGGKTTGTLITQNLELGGNLWLMATGTGIAPFVSILRDPATYSDFDNIYVTWTTRTQAEQDAYRIMLEEANCTFIPTITREEFHTQGRITNLIKEGKVFNEATPEKDKVMLCGSTAFNHEMKAYLTARGWHEGNKSTAGNFVQEKAFVG